MKYLICMLVLLSGCVVNASPRTDQTHDLLVAAQAAYPDEICFSATSNTEDKFIDGFYCLRAAKPKQVNRIPSPSPSPSKARARGPQKRPKSTYSAGYFAGCYDNMIEQDKIENKDSYIFSYQKRYATAICKMREKKFK